MKKAHMNIFLGGGVAVSFIKHVFSYKSHAACQGQAFGLAF